jgi:hypothetical protein
MSFRPDRKRLGRKQPDRRQDADDGPDDRRGLDGMLQRLNTGPKKMALDSTSVRDLMGRRR